MAIQEDQEQAEAFAQVLGSLMGWAADQDHDDIEEDPDMPWFGFANAEPIIDRAIIKVEYRGRVFDIVVRDRTEFYAEMAEIQAGR